MILMFSAWSLVPLAEQTSPGRGRLPLPCGLVADFDLWVMSPARFVMRWPRSARSAGCLAGPGMAGPSRLLLRRRPLHVRASGGHQAYRLPVDGDVHSVQVRPVTAGSANILPTNE